MNRETRSKASLNKIKLIFFFIVIIGAGFFSFDATRKPGFVIVLATLIIECYFYVCPYCKKSLDPRISLDSSPYCPKCSKKIV